MAGGGRHNSDLNVPNSRNFAEQLRLIAELSCSCSRCGSSYAANFGGYASYSKRFYGVRFLFAVGYATLHYFAAKSMDVISDGLPGSTSIMLMKHSDQVSDSDQFTGTGRVIGLVFQDLFFISAVVLIVFLPVPRPLTVPALLPAQCLALLQCHALLQYLPSYLHSVLPSYTVPRPLTCTVRGK